MFKKTTLLVLLLTLLSVQFSVVSAEGDNLLVNSSFEEEQDGAPANWISETYNKDAGAVEFKIESQNPKDGNKYVTVINNKESDSRYLQAVEVKETKKYKLSCWIKAENVGETKTGAILSIGSRYESTNPLLNTNGKWEYVEMYANIGQGIETINVTVGVGGYSSINTGKASFDDVRMVEVDQIPEGAVVANIEKIDTNNNNEGNNSENTNNSSEENSTGGLGSVVWIVLLLAVIVVGVATFNTLKSRNQTVDKPVEKNKKTFADDEDDLVNEFEYDEEKKDDKS